MFVLFGVLAVTGGLMAWTDYSARQGAEAFPPMGQFVEAEGIRLHYIDEGQGQPVVLLHGASGNLRDWKLSIYDDVASKYRAIAFDRPGHGYSDRMPEQGWDPRVQARAIHTALEKMGVEKPILVGHSWAGTLVLAYALQYPDDVGGVLFVAGVSHPWPGGVGVDREIGATPVIGHFFAQTIVTPVSGLVAEAAVESVFAPNPAPEGYAANIGMPLIVRPDTFRHNAEDLAKLKPILREMAPLYPRIDMPFAVVTGDSDDVIWTHLHSDPLPREIKGATMRVLPGVGHMPHHSAPGPVLEELDKLAARVAAAG